MKDTDLTAEKVREILDYDPDTGKFMRKYSSGRKPTGTKTYGGYIRITIAGKAYSAHRLAWLYSTGKWPEVSIDHIDGQRDNNRLDNLREADHRLNAQNMKGPRTDNSSGYLGVSRKRKLWRATIYIQGEQKSLGSFKTPEEASMAYLDAKREFHEGCTI